MQLRPLGSSGLLVSPICLGTMTFGSPVAETDAIKLTHFAIDEGINFVDTANAYEGYTRYLGSPGGVAEEIVGKAIHDRREKVVLATKVGAPVGPGPQDRGLSASHILRELDQSLSRLKTDYIDLYIIHWPDKYVPLDVTLNAMETAVRQGKIRCFGASNHAAWQMCEMLWLADKHNLPHVVSSQVPFSLLRREFHHDLQFCEKHDIAVTPYQPLQSGLLTGKYKRGSAPPAGSRAEEKPDWIWQQDDPLFDKLEAIESLANSADIPMAQYALAWALTQPAIRSVIVGIKNQSQIEDALQAAKVTIPQDHLAQLDMICPPPWQQPDPMRGA
ncbi:L-glyceraldehyde 3-phosphate reductase [Polystyrenella longa]|uniref:L-glyceraldehyde 3-phosphate reductase n=1 Tax=Polystyrenella longa TaxID=2528007 RepID=A0A518CJB8_9PLAN|nr:aldo/keto reductase [Polystyrenella longa]QDU79297.1 L-glyceraldehyde 3-phosphate reductase [Polystyrenella longa]